MKNRALVLLSLIIAITALGHGVWLHANARHIAAEALREREAQLVERLEPTVRAMIHDMTGEAHAVPTNSQTLEELFEPFAELITRADPTIDDQVTE